MKKFLYVVLVLALGIFPLYACGQSISLNGNEYAYQGQDVVIPIRYANFDSIGSQAFTIALNYDTLAIDMFHIQEPNGWIIATNHIKGPGNGLFVMSGMTAADTINGDGLLLTLVATIKRDAPIDSTTLSWNYTDFFPTDYLTSQQYIPVTGPSLTFEIRQLMVGDVDGDQAISYHDWYLILERTTGNYAGFEVPWNDRRNLAADVDENGSIEAFDAEYLWSMYH